MKVRSIPQRRKQYLTQMVILLFLFARPFCVSASTVPVQSKITGTPKSGFRWCLRTSFEKNNSYQGTKYEQTFGDPDGWPSLPVAFGTAGPALRMVVTPYWHPNYVELSFQFKNGLGRQFQGNWHGDTLVLKTMISKGQPDRIAILVEKKGTFVVVQKDSGEPIRWESTQTNTCEWRPRDKSGHGDLQLMTEMDTGAVFSTTLINQERAIVKKNGYKHIFYKAINGKVNWFR